MSKKKKAIGIIIIIMVTLALGISVGDNDPKIRTQFEVVEGARLRVSLEGVEEGHEVNLYNHEDYRVGTANISSDDMTKRFIGVVQATVEVSMADEGNPTPGEYRLEVKDTAGDKLIYDENLTFEGPEIEITDLEFDGEGDGSETDLKVEVENSGDLPIFVDKMMVNITGNLEQIDFDEPIELMAEETSELNGTLSLDIEKGDQATVELFSFGESVYTYETNVTY